MHWSILTGLLLLKIFRKLSMDNSYSNDINIRRIYFITFKHEHGKYILVHYCQFLFVYLESILRAKHIEREHWTLASSFIDRIGMNKKELEINPRNAALSSLNLTSPRRTWAKTPPFLPWIFPELQQLFWHLQDLKEINYRISKYLEN